MYRTRARRFQATPTLLAGPLFAQKTRRLSVKCLALDIEGAPDLAGKCSMEEVKIRFALSSVQESFGTCTRDKRDAMRLMLALGEEEAEGEAAYIISPQVRLCAFVFV